MVPDVDENGLLPPGRHAATWEEIQDKFVKEAPFDAARSLIFSALELHFRIMSEIVPSGRLWIDGGFTTHKIWGAPKDADLVYFLKTAELNQIPPEDQMRMVNLVTLQAVQAAAPRIDHVDRIQPMGGLIDAFVVAEEHSGNMEYWHGEWSRVKGEDGLEMPGVTKGYLEVTW